jgi:PASTA domain
MRLASLLPRAVIVATVWILGTAAFTFAADSTIVGPSPSAESSQPAQPQELVVPSVVGQAYVFSKGILEDAGFAWHVKGSVRGYSSNRVLTQSPAPGTRVVDTGAPTVTLRLVRGPYEQLGTPQDSAPYAGSAIRLAGLAAVTTPAKKKTSPVKKQAVAKKPVASKKQPAPKKAVKHHARKLTARPPAFTPKDAPKEPLGEITLPARALRLEAWVAGKPRTSSNVQHWLYQHAWIVTGAKFGWWHGAQALQTLIRVDQRLQRQWSVGGKSEAVARAALAQVSRKSR